MKVLYALLCEHAHERQDGRLDVHGVFHLLYAPRFPAQQPEMTLALAVEWEPHERGRQELAMDLLDPSSSPVLTLSGPTDVVDQGPLAGPPRTRIVMPLQNVVFPAEGTYVFELRFGEVRQRLAALHLIRNATH